MATTIANRLSRLEKARKMRGKHSVQVIGGYVPNMTIDEWEAKYLPQQRALVAKGQTLAAMEPRDIQAGRKL